jgi:hypothetical protein
MLGETAKHHEIHKIAGYWVENPAVEAVLLTNETRRFEVQRELVVEINR